MTTTAAVATNRQRQISQTTTKAKSCKVRTKFVAWSLIATIVISVVINLQKISQLKLVQVEDELQQHKNMFLGSLSDFSSRTAKKKKIETVIKSNRKNKKTYYRKHQQNDKNNNNIREWGCDRTETPLIFVHNGKSGGGGIRARFAASAMNYSRRNWNEPHKDKHYYPIRNNNNNNNIKNGTTTTTITKTRKGKFCNSVYPHYTEIPGIQNPLTQANYEGAMYCNATTPFGIAIACPHPYKKGRSGTEKDTKARQQKLKGNSRGGITLEHYQSLDCPKCDDDYYLDVDYYFDSKFKGNNNRVPLPTTTDIHPDQDPNPERTCDIVFTAHNNIGSELNWLPPRYLKEHWWDNSVYGGKDRNDDGEEEDDDDELERYWATLLDDRNRRRKQLLRKINSDPDDLVNDDPNHHQSTTSARWCPNGYIPIYSLDAERRARYKDKYVERPTRYDRPSTFEDYLGAYQSCGKSLAEKADKAFLAKFYSSSQNNDNNNNRKNGNNKNGDNGNIKKRKLNYSPFYASMPLHRITMLRDPWSWIVSKFFWHHLERSVSSQLHQNRLPCVDVTYPVMARDVYGKDSVPKDPFTGRSLGWVEQFSLINLIKLCGNDCRIRYENAMMTLEEIEDQAESNLRHAFSVVGLLNETESFYDMITDRIDYVNMTYNQHIQGSDHATLPSEENKACKKLFETNEEFRESVRQKVPAFAALERIYNVGIEVNRFQKEELQRCRISKGETLTKGTYGTPKNDPKYQTRHA